MTNSAVLGYGLSRFLILIPITIALQRRYARYLNSWITHITTFITWSLAFSLVYVLPLDLIPTNKDNLITVWKVIYWMSFALCWLVVPLIQDYYANGAFTFKRRIISSIRFNIKFYAVAGAILTIFLISKMIASRLTIDELGGFVICLANTWGLLLLVLLLGYGLVEVPRSMWYSSNRGIALKRCYYKLSNLHSSAIEQQDRLEQIFSMVDDLNKSVPSTNPFRTHVDKIVGNCPPVRSFESTMRVEPDGRCVEAVKRLIALRKKPFETWTERDLEELNYLCIKANNAIRVLNSDWSDTMEEAHELEFIQGWQQTQGGLNNPNVQLPANVRHRSTVYQYYWRLTTFIAPISYRVLAVLFATLSLIMLWGELALVFPGNLSPMSHILKATKSNYFISQTLCLFYLFYIVWCTFYTLFKVRLSSFYFMDPRGHTNAVSILHNAAFMLRVLPALGYNFFAVLNLKDTAFQYVIGTMKTVPFLGGPFNRYFPIVMCLFSICSFFNLFSKLLQFLNIPHFRYSEKFDDEHVVEGRTLYEADKRRRGIDVFTGTGMGGGIGPNTGSINGNGGVQAGSDSPNLQFQQQQQPSRYQNLRSGPTNSASSSGSSKAVRQGNVIKGGGSLMSQLDAL